MKSSNAYAHFQFSNSICYIIYGTIDPLCTQKRSMYEYKHYLYFIARVLLYMHKSIPYPLFPPITNTIKILLGIADVTVGKYVLYECWKDCSTYYILAI